MTDMRSRRWVMWLVLMSVLAASCAGDSSDADERLAAAEQRIEELEELLDRAPAIGEKVGERSAPPASEASSTTVQEPTGRSLSVFALQVGDCFDDQEDLTETLISGVATVDCSLPHDNEIYFEYSMIDAAFPGDDPGLESASIRCLDEFDTFVGTAYLDSELDLFPIIPTAESWSEGDRVVYCVVYAFDLSKLEGTLRGSRR